MPGARVLWFLPRLPALWPFGRGQHARRRDECTGEGFHAAAPTTNNTSTRQPTQLACTISSVSMACRLVNSFSRSPANACRAVAQMGQTDGLAGIEAGRTSAVADWAQQPGGTRPALPYCSCHHPYPCPCSPARPLPPTPGRHAGSLAGQRPPCLDVHFAAGGADGDQRLGHCFIVAWLGVGQGFGGVGGGHSFTRRGSGGCRPGHALPQCR